VKIVKGKTTNEKLDSIDLILSRLTKREKKHAYAMISPIPISSYTEIIAGPLLKYMFPAAGVVSDILIYVEVMPKAGINLTATLASGTGAISKNSFTKKQLSIADSDFDVIAGDRITVEVEKVKDEEIVSGIWIAFLWTPSKASIEVKQFLLDEILKGTEDPESGVKESEE
jgi:hypothetical protein